MKLSLVLLAGLAAAGCLRSRSAALRHWIVAAAILCAAATPLIETLVPAWPVYVAATPDVAQVLVTAGGATGTVAPEPGGARAAADASRFSPFSASAWLARIWLSGIAISLLLVSAGLGRLAWLTSRARIASSRWVDLCVVMSRDSGLRRPVRLLQSDHPSLLATWGLVRPAIILPAGAGDWSVDLMRVVLSHELAHIRRADWLIQMLGELLRAVYWFNPLVWLACGRLRTESEQACDDDVLSRGVDPSAYATHLIRLARNFSQPRPWFPAPAMARPSTLHRRVAAMLNSRVDRRPVHTRARVATLALMLAATFAVAAAQTFSTFSGTLVDPQGGVMPGVHVVLSNVERQAKYDVETTRTGQFEFPGLIPGDYMLQIEVPGFRKYEAPVTVGASSLQQTIALQLGQVRETISVTDDGGDTPRVSPTATARPNPACGPQPASGDVRIGGNIRPPRKIKDVHPVYPASLRGTGASGDVTLDAIIGTDGFITDVRAREGAQPAFAEALITAVRQWEFDSTLLNCVPVDVSVTITGHFAPQR